MQQITLTDQDCVWDAGAVLGEGPIWSPSQRSLYWVDIKGPALHRLGLDDGQRQSWPMSERIGFAVERANGEGFVVGLKTTGFALLSLPECDIRPLGHPEADLPTNRFNDAKADASGRLWAGTMDDSEREPSGWLYRLDPDGRWQRCDGPYVVTNGPAIDPQRQILYHTDSANRTVYAFDLKPDGNLAGKRVFVQLGSDEGFPDGMTVDTEGGVWVAHFGGARVTRFDPHGRVKSIIHLPVSQVTSCCFAGDDLDQLYITTASVNLDTDTLRNQPLAGGLFLAVPGVRGLATARFGG